MRIEKIKKPGFIIDIRYSREEVPGTAVQRYENNLYMIYG
jgi:hypothetical protein